MKITTNCFDILTRILECQIVTTTQLAIYSQRSRQVIRRNIRQLEGNGLIASKKQGYGQGQGRPEKILFLTQKGVEVLKDNGFLSDQAPLSFKNSTDSYLVGHHLLTNWFHLHLIHMSDVMPRLSVIFLHANSYFLNGKNRTRLKETVFIKGGMEKPAEFYPDSVFSLSYQGNNHKKILLFFLEVDMGTETLAGKNTKPNNIQQKITNYQTLFYSKKYKRYERIFKSSLNGFRLLFLTNTPSRMVSLCNIIPEIPPSDFIWVTSQDRMFSHGLSSEIWALGGRKDDPPQSIMGPKYACQSALTRSIK